MNKKIFFTTSWDDGSVYDRKLSELLYKYNIKGTFYIPIINEERPVMPVSDIRVIAEKFEVGGHTYSHKTLTSLPDKIAMDEISKGKIALENILGDQLFSFCFPRGKYNNKHIKMVRDAGFDFARTVGFTRTRKILNRSKGLMHTTLQIYPHIFSTYFRCALSRLDIEGGYEILTNYNKLNNLEQFLDVLLDKCTKYGGVIHLWGHSWEIEENNLWEKLETILRKIVSIKNVGYCTNGELWNEYEG